MKQFSLFTYFFPFLCRPSFFYKTNKAYSFKLLCLLILIGLLPYAAQAQCPPDPTDPTALCQDVTLDLDASGNLTLIGTEIDNGSSDNCAITSFAISPNTYSCTEIGTSPHTATLTVEDAAMNQSTCMASITVRDVISPTALCKDLTVNLNGAGSGSLVASNVNNNSTDGCGIQNMMLNPFAFNCGNTGANTVTLTVIDNYNNVGTCTANIAVADVTPPTALCKDVTVCLDGTGQATVLASNTSVTLANSSTGFSGTQGTNGWTYGRYSAFNPAGYNNLVRFTGFVWNTNEGNILDFAQLDANGGHPQFEGNVWAVRRWTSNYTGQVTISGNFFDRDNGCGDGANVRIFHNGTEVFQFLNISTSSTPYSFTLKVVSGDVIDFAIDPKFDAACDDTHFTGVITSVPNGIDNGSNDVCGIASLDVSPSTFGCDDVATSPNTVTLTVTDVNGNQSTCTAGVTVEYESTPVALCEDITVCLDVNGNASIVGSDVDDGSSDLCDLNLSVSPNTFNCTSIPGPHLVTLTAIANNGNQATCTANVTVKDDVAPTALCKDITLCLDASGNATLVLSDIDNGSSDACGITTPTFSPSTFTCASIASNPHTVTLTVTDNNSNQSTCTAGVEVQDKIDPTASCRDVTVQLDATGNASISESHVDNGSNDNCGIATYDTDVTTFDCSNTGAPVNVTLTVTDVNANQSTCTADVTVEDNEAPTASCKTEKETADVDVLGSSQMITSDKFVGQSFKAGTSGILSKVSIALVATQLQGNITLSVYAGGIPSGVGVPLASTTVNPGNISGTTIVDFIFSSPTSISAGNDYLWVVNQNDPPANPGHYDYVMELVNPGGPYADGVLYSGSSVVGMSPNFGGNADLRFTTYVSVSPVPVCLDASGNATLALSDIDNGSSDACGITTPTFSPSTFTCASIASNPHAVTLTVTDNNGNQSTCTAGVEVQDKTAPTALCKDITIDLDAQSGTASIASSDVNNNSSDNCGITSESLSLSTFDCDDIATNPNTVTLSVDDAAGNGPSTCTAGVTLRDVTDPVPDCLADVTLDLDVNGSLSVALSDIDNASSDNCGITVFSSTPNTFDCASIGTSPNSVTATLEDAAGNQNTCSVSVTVRDNVSPTALCQDITVDLDMTGNASISHSAVDNSSNDACGIASFATDVTTFDCDDLNGVSVTLTVTDNHSNQSTCTANVTVNDPLSACCAQPMAMCKNTTVSLDPAGNYTLAASEVNNNSLAGCGLKSLGVSPNTFNCGSVNSSPHTVTLTITDDNLASDQCTASVTVEDNTNPTATCQNLTVSLNASGSTSITPGNINNGSTDACGIASLAVSPNTFDCDDVAGSPNTVTLTVTDNHANQSTCTAGVTVEDNTNPTAICQDITISLNASGNASIDATDVNNGSNDACGIATYSSSPNTFDCDDIASSPNTVTLTVTDNNANQSICTAGVTVEDNTNPTAICQDLSVHLDAAGNASISGADVDGGSNDACGIASLSASSNTFDCNDIATSPNPVTLTVTDNNANQSICTAGVTVEDNTDPTAICQDLTLSMDANGNLSVAASDVDNGSNDACGIASLALSPNTFDCDDVATSPNTVTLTVTDNNANQSTCTAGITVEDNTNPTAICKDVTVSLGANGQVMVPVVSILANSAADFSGTQGAGGWTYGRYNAVGGPGTFGLLPNFTGFVWNTQGEGNILDFAQLDVNGGHPQFENFMFAVRRWTSNYAGAIQINGDFFDRDLGGGDGAHVRIFHNGTQVFEWLNISGASQAYSLNLTIAVGDVIDFAIDPKLTVANDDTHFTGVISTVADGIDNGSSDACGIASLTVSPNTFDCGDIAANPNTVTLTVVDNNGNQSTCTAGVTVEDNTNPTAVCQDLTLSLDANGDLSVDASDVDNGSSDACGIASLSASPNTFDCDDIATSPNTVTLIVTDNYTNQSSCTAGVTVEDNTDPTAICADITVHLDAAGNGGISAGDVDGGSNDACGIATYAVSPNTFDCTSIATNPNIVTLTITDNHSNMSTCTAMVTALDTVSPAANCQDITISLDASGNATIEGTDVNNGSNDACGIASLAVSPNTFDCDDIATSPNSVTLTVTDGNGNTDNCGATVTVEDNTDPTALCQDITVNVNPTGITSIVASDVDNGSSDACGIASTSVAPNTFSCNTPGSNTVTLTVTDVNSNVSTCTANVEVQGSGTVPGLSQQNCGNCGQIRIFYCRNDQNPFALSEFIDGTAQLNATYSATDTLRWYDDVGNAPAGLFNGTGEEPPIPNLNATSTTFYWVTQVDPVTGCESPAIRVRVRVRNTPDLVMTQPNSFCDGAPFDFTFYLTDNNNAADLYELYDTDPALGGSSIGSVTATNGTPDNSLNIFPGVGTHTYWVVGTNVFNRPPSCGDTVSVTIVVNAAPVVAPIMDITVCPGDPIVVPSFTADSAGATFAWNNNNTAIGLGANGLGNIPAFTAPTNNTGTSIVGTISVRAIVNGCVSQTATFNIVIQSGPRVMPATSMICSGDPSGILLLTGVGSVPATTFDLVDIRMDAGLVADPGNATTGAGQLQFAISGDIFTNTTGGDLTVEYDVAGSSSAGCVGDTATITLTVKAEPVLTIGLADTICSGTTSSLALTLSNGLAGASFTWTTTLPAGITGSPSTGPGTAIMDNLVNNTASPIDVIYDVTPTAGGCQGQVGQVTVRVNPFGTVVDKPLFECDNPGTPGIATFDLTASGNAGPYYLDASLMTPISGSPSAYTSTNDTVFGVQVNASGCQDLCQIILNVGDLPQAMAFDINTCDNQSTLILPTPPLDPSLSFNFYGDAGLTNLLAGSAISYDPMTTPGTSPDTVYITMTDGACESSIATRVIVTVQAAPTPVISANLTSNSICENDTLFLSGAGGTSYSWRKSGTIFSTQQNTFVPDVLLSDSGYYYLTVSDGLGCFATDSVFVHVDSLPDPGLSNVIFVPANQGPINLIDSLLGTPLSGGVWAGPMPPYNGSLGTFDPSYFLPGVYTYTLTNPVGCQDSFSFATVTVNVVPVNAPKASVFMLLEGVLVGTGDTAGVGGLVMHDSLRSQGLIPQSQIYGNLSTATQGVAAGTITPYTHVNGGGNESVNFSVLNTTGLFAPVDWVYLELRNPADSSVVSTRSALLLRNGQVVDLDGVSPVSFNKVPAGNYLLAAGHRSHLAVMTVIPMYLDSSTTIIDLTSPFVPVAGGISGRRTFATSTQVALFAADANANGQIQNDDDTDVWQIQVGGGGYFQADYDMDGQVQNDDRVKLWQRNVGRGSQVP